MFIGISGSCLVVTPNNMTDFFAGTELAQELPYLRNAGEELQVNLRYPRILEPLIKKYISLFGLPDIGFQLRYSLLKQFAEEVQATLKPSSRWLFFDAGCGSGTNTRLMHRLFPKAKVVAVDIVPGLVQMAKRASRSTRLHFKVADLTKPQEELRGKANFVWCFDVLEHIPNYKRALKNMALTLKKGGYLAIHVPQPRQRRHLVFFRDWAHDTHEREGLMITELLKSLPGFEVVRIKETFGYLGSLIWEINIFLFKKVPPLGAMLFPLLRLIAELDLYVSSRKYNCLGVLLQKMA